MKSPRVLTAAELREQEPKPHCMYLPQGFLELDLLQLMESAQKTFPLEYPTLPPGIDPTQTVTGGERPGTAS